MKRFMLGLLVLIYFGITHAETVNVEVHQLGSGAVGFEVAQPWDAGASIYHTPQYLPGYPTAATLWPRVVDVKCKRIEGKLQCDGYDWYPELGRGEYLFIRPHIEEAVIVPQKTLIIEKTVFVEVKPKKKGE